MPNGLTQKVSGSPGSRTVMCPVTPSENPSRLKILNPSASCSFRYSRSASAESKVGGSGNGNLRSANPTAFSVRSRGLGSVAVMVMERVAFLKETICVGEPAAETKGRRAVMNRTWAAIAARTAKKAQIMPAVAGCASPATATSTCRRALDSAEIVQVPSGPVRS